MGVVQLEYTLFTAYGCSCIMCT